MSGNGTLPAGCLTRMTVEQFLVAEGVLPQPDVEDVVFDDFVEWVEDTNEPADMTPTEWYDAWETYTNED